MKLSYRKYPILRFADIKYLDERKEFFRKAYDGENPHTEEERILLSIAKNIMLNGVLTNKPIYFLSDPFIEAVQNNQEKLSVISRDDKSSLMDNVIFVSRQGNIFVQHVIGNSSFVLWLKPNGECVSYSVHNKEGNGIDLFEVEQGKAQGAILFISYNLLFIKYASVELDIIEAGSKKKSSIADKGKVINELGVDVTLLDSRWFREIIRNEGFKVSGHFRLQPCKDENGEWKRKLIYIKDFEKHGYHRRAQISIENEDIDN